jgi:hypothetical protein
MRKIDEYLDTREDLNRDTKTDIKYYIDMRMASELAVAPRVYPYQLATLVPKVMSLESETLRTSCEKVLTIYRSLGGTDTVAKNPEMRRKIIEELAQEFPRSQRERIRVVRGQNGRLLRVRDAGQAGEAKKDS